MHRERLSVAALAVSLLASALACQIDVGGPELPGDPIAVSTEAAESLDEVWANALRDAPRSGTIVVLLDEAQLTSYFALRSEADPNPLLDEPQVFLRDGVIQVYGITRQGALKASVLVTVAPLLDDDGRLAFEVTSADVGPLPVPDAVRQSISAILTEAFTTPIGALATGVRITSIAIADGQIAIVGEFR